MKKVRFNEHVRVYYLPEGEDRRSDWLDRYRFKRRIESIEPLLTQALMNRLTIKDDRVHKTV